VKKHFGRRLGYKVEVIFLLRGKNTLSEIRKKIFASDIIYVGGGDTLKMMRCWRELGVDKILREAYEKGIVLSGISAGAICWFSFGNSDSSMRIKKEGSMIKVRGIGLIKILFCPHYDVEKQRRPELKKMMGKTSGVAIALENCTAIEIIDNYFRIIRSKTTANAYKVYWKNGKYFENKIPMQEKFVDLTTLLVKG
jgi:dipeptidase E